MAHYVTADLHGERERFHRLMQLIGFSGEDTLYIIGDVIDRGPDGIALLHEILQTPNIVLLMGNHEYMMLQYFAPDATELDHRRWSRNGNAPTLEAFLRLSEVERRSLLDTLGKLPTHLSLTVCGQQFYLVHGFPADSVHDELWSRPRLDTPAPFPYRRVIVGHTNVLHLRPREEADMLAADMEAHGQHLRICHAEGFIDLDCGCGYASAIKSMACLRLEDGAEYYVDSRR